MMLCPSPPLSDPSWSLWVAEPPQSYPLLPYSWAGAVVRVAAQCQAVCRVHEVPWAGSGLGTKISLQPHECCAPAGGVLGCLVRNHLKGLLIDHSTDANSALILNYLSTDILQGFFCLPLGWAGSCMHRMHFCRYQLDKQHPIAQSLDSTAATKEEKNQGTKKELAQILFLRIRAVS